MSIDIVNNIEFSSSNSSVHHFSLIRYFRNVPKKFMLGRKVKLVVIHLYRHCSWWGWKWHLEGAIPQLPTLLDFLLTSLMGARQGGQVRNNWDKHCLCHINWLISSPSSIACGYQDQAVTGERSIGELMAGFPHAKNQTHLQQDIAQHCVWWHSPMQPHQCFFIQAHCLTRVNYLVCNVRYHFCATSKWPRHTKIYHTLPVSV